MKEILLFDPYGEQDVALNQIKEFGFDPFFVSEEEKALASFADHHFDLLISEIPNKETSNATEYFQKIEQINASKSVPQVILTRSRDLFDISVVELFQIRDILFKPAETNTFKNTIIFNLIPAKRIQLLCSRKHSPKFEESIKVFKIPYQISNSWTEFSRINNFLGNQLIVFEEGFEGALPVQFLNTLMAKSPLKKIPVIFFMNRKDPALERLVASYGAGVILVPPFRWDVLEMLIRQLMIKMYSLTLTEESPVKPAAVLKESKMEEVPEAKIDPMDETESGNLSVNQCLKVLPSKINDPAIRTAFTQFLKTGNPRMKETCIAKINTTGGSELVNFLRNAYQVGNNLLRETIIDMLADVSDIPEIMALLLRACGDKLPKIQVTALMGLFNYDVNETAAMLRQLLNSPHPKVRMTAARGLEKYKGLEVYPDFYRVISTSEETPLIESFIRYFEQNFDLIKDLKILLPLFQSGSNRVKERVLDLFLIKKDTRIGEYLPVISKTDDRVLIRMVIEGYALCKDAKGLPFLLGQINTREGDTAENAILSVLEKYVDPKYIVYFQMVIEKGSDNLREKVIDMIRAFKSDVAQPAVKVALAFGGSGVKVAVLDLLTTWKDSISVYYSTLLLDDHDRNVASHAAKILKSMALKNHIEILIEAFKQLKQDEAKSTVSEVLSGIVAGEDQGLLNKMMKQDSYSQLIAILEKSGVSLGKYTTQVLGKHASDKDSLEVLIKTLNDKNYEARTEAILALAEAGREEAKPYIAKLLDDPEWYVRRVALEGLSKLNAREFDMQILKCLKDENPAVRTQAAGTLFALDIRFQEPLIPFLLEESSDKVVEQMLLLLAPFKDQKVLTMHGPKMSSPLKMTRVTAAVEFLLAWEHVDKKWLEGWKTSRVWYLKVLPMVYEFIRQREAFNESVAMYLKDPSQEVRMALFDLILIKFGSEKEKIEWCFKLLADESPMLKGKVLAAMTSFSNMSLIDLSHIKNYFINENDPAILNFYKEFYVKRIKPEDEQGFFEDMSDLPEGIHKEIIFELVQRLNPAVSQN